MGWKKTAAETLDTTASALHKVGGKAGDAVANVALAPIRRHIDEDCTNCAKGKCENPS